MMERKKETEESLMPGLWTVLCHDLIVCRMYNGSICLKSCSYCCIPRVMTEVAMTGGKNSVAENERWNLSATDVDHWTPSDMYDSYSLDLGGGTNGRTGAWAIRNMRVMKQLTAAG